MDGHIMILQQRVIQLGDRMDNLEDRVTNIENILGLHQNQQPNHRHSNSF